MSETGAGDGGRVRASVAGGVGQVDVSVGLELRVRQHIEQTALAGEVHGRHAGNGCADRAIRDGGDLIDHHVKELRPFGVGLLVSVRKLDGDPG